MSSAATWARAQPRISDGAAARKSLTAWWRSSMSSGEALAGRPSRASSSTWTAACPVGRSAGAVIGDLPGTRRDAGGVRGGGMHQLDPHFRGRRGRDLTPEGIVRSGPPPAHPSGRTFRPGPWRASGGRERAGPVSIDTGPVSARRPGRCSGARRSGPVVPPAVADQRAGALARAGGLPAEHAVERRDVRPEGHQAAGRAAPAPPTASAVPWVRRGTRRSSRCPPPLSMSSRSR